MTNGTSASQDGPSAYMIFVGGIDQVSVKRIVDKLVLATQLQPMHKVHLAFQSSGGFVGDGIMLYETFKSLPIDLTVYNLGTVASIAALAFLGAGKRKATASAAFMFHRTSNPIGQPASASQVKLLAESMSLDDERSEGIIRSRLQLTETQLGVHRTGDLWFNAKDALAAGIIDEIADFAPPLGHHVLSI